MAQNHIQKGDVLNFVNSTESTILSGAPVVVGTLVGVALSDIPDGAAGSVAIKEVWTLPKLAGNAIAQGALVYLTPGGSITPTESGNTLAGKAFKAAGSADTEINVLLNA